MELDVGHVHVDRAATGMRYQRRPNLRVKRTHWNAVGEHDRYEDTLVLDADALDPSSWQVRRDHLGKTGNQPGHRWTRQRGRRYDVGFVGALRWRALVAAHWTRG